MNDADPQTRRAALQIAHRCVALLRRDDRHEALRGFFQVAVEELRAFKPGVKTPRRPPWPPELRSDRMTF
jgi:hypothetical protein